MKRLNLLRPASTLQGFSVALVRPPMLVARGNHMTFACPPLGIAYLGAVLRDAGARVALIDAVGEAPEQRRLTDDGRSYVYGLSVRGLRSRIPKTAQLIGVSCMFSEEWPLARAVIRELGEHFPEATIVAGGEHVTAVPQLVLEQCPELDFCVVGEGEQTLLELCVALKNGDSALLPGVIGRGAGPNQRRARVRAIDELPRPAWDLLPMENYLSRGLGYGVKRGRSIPILATRGCPFSCTFCSSPQMWTTRWAARSPEAVLDEMGEGIERYRARNFDFYDLTAIVRKDWIEEFCRKLVERDYRITWQIPAGTRSEAIDANVARWLYRSGCRNIAYAPESGSPAVLRRIKKKVNLDVMKQSMSDAVHAGLMVKCNIIVGFPDETRDEVLDTLRLCRELARIGVQDINVTPFCPYPGSVLFDQLLDREEVSLDDEYFDRLASYSDLTRAASFCAAMSSRELGFWRWWSMLEFYGRSFAGRPRRFASLLQHLARGQQTTRLERALSDILERNAPGLSARIASAGDRRAGFVTEHGPARASESAP
ncbi:MAG: radical SAM protein [Polyangiaceae bacterium]